MASHFSEHEQDLIQKAIELAERRTSGEIRVCIEKTCSQTTLDRATEYFRKLGMDKTFQRNGVLIYLAMEDKKLAIIGDSGIHTLVPENFWQTTKETMLVFFKQSRIADGVISGIQIMGQKLQEHFPRLGDKPNELPDDIVFADGH